jgi:hypothetical protein
LANLSQGVPTAPPQPQQPSLDGLPRSVLIELARQIQQMQQRVQGPPPQYSPSVAMGIRG